MQVSFRQLPSPSSPGHFPLCGGDACLLYVHFVCRALKGRKNVAHAGVLAQFGCWCPICAGLSKAPQFEAKTVQQRFKVTLPGFWTVSVGCPPMQFTGCSNYGLNSYVLPPDTLGQTPRIHGRV